MNLNTIRVKFLNRKQEENISFLTLRAALVVLSKSPILLAYSTRKFLEWDSVTS